MNIPQSARQGFALILALGFIATLSVTVFGLVNQVLLIQEESHVSCAQQSAYHLAYQASQIGLAQLSTPWFIPSDKETDQNKLDPVLVPLAVINRWQTLTFDPAQDGGLAGTVQLYITIGEGGLALGAVAGDFGAEQKGSGQKIEWNKLFQTCDTVLATAWGSTHGAGATARFMAQVIQEGQKFPGLYEDMGLVLDTARAAWQLPRMRVYPEAPGGSQGSLEKAPRVGSLSELYTLRICAPRSPDTQRSPDLPPFDVRQDGIALLYMNPLWARIAGLNDGFQDTLADRIKRVQELAQLKPADSTAKTKMAAWLEQWWGLGYAKWPEVFRAVGNPEGVPMTAQIVVQATYEGVTVHVTWHAVRDEKTGRYVSVRCAPMHI